MVHPHLRPEGRLGGRPRHEHDLVRGPDAHGAPRDRAGHGARGRRPALPGPAGAAPGPDLSGLRRHRRLRCRPPRRRGHGPALRRGHDRGSPGHLQRRPRRGRPRHRRHHDPDRRGRRVPGRRARPPGAPAAAQPRGRRHGRVDERDRHGPGQGVPGPAGQPDRPGPHHHDGPPHRHQHPRARGRRPAWPSTRSGAARSPATSSCSSTPTSATARRARSSWSTA